VSENRPWLGNLSLKAPDIDEDSTARRHVVYSGSSAGVVEEEVIDEEETDMAAYVMSRARQYENWKKKVREQLGEERGLTTSSG